MFVSNYLCIFVKLLFVKLNAMNKKLVFSWGHIIALLAIIAFSYLAFTGFCYYTGGRFLFSGLLVAAIDLFLILVFIGAQQLKIWDGPFQKYIIVERWMLFVLAPLAVAVAMIPVNHWLGLRSNETEFASQFTEAIDTAKVMFSDYESYATDRINQLGDRLYQEQKKASANRSKDGIGGESADLQAERKLNRENTMRALRLQLIGQNYEDLHKAAMQWMEETADEPSTLNVFLLGNINEINSAITRWNQQLSEFSARRLSSEPKQTADYSTDSPYVAQSATLLKGLRDLCRERQPLNTTSLWIALGFFVLMMVPWWAQNRNTKSRHCLTGRRGHTLLERLVDLVSGTKHKRGSRMTIGEDDDDYYVQKPKGRKIQY